MSKTVNHIYFLGIGGIGMSALARYFHTKGCKVSGYDRTSSPLTKKLEEEGMSVHYQDDPALVPDDIDMAVVTPAIPADSLELNFIRERGVKMLKRAEVLGEVSRHSRSVAVSGTHGKTTVTAMITHLLNSSGRLISAFVGGIAKNMDSNVIVGDDNDEFVVMEADEFDRSFLHLTPYVSVVTSIDADHLDIYGDKTQLEEAFNQFVERTLPEGVVVYNSSLPINTRRKALSYGCDDADVTPVNVAIVNEMTTFELVTREGMSLGVYEMQLYGRHNVMNATAAIVTCLQLGVDIKQIKEGLAAFRGVQRRFDIRYKDEKRCYIDDYAHHPEEIRACLKAVREVYPDRKVTLVFQPHLFTRTRDFMDEFADALSLADSLLLMEIYPAREKPLPGISSSALLQKVSCGDKQICRKEELIATIKERNPELLITMGAGDIDRFVPQIETLLKQ